MKHDDKNKSNSWHRALCLLEKHLACDAYQNGDGWLLMGRVSVFLSDELEKKLRLKTVEMFGGRKGDLSKAVEEAVKTWVEKEQ